MPDYGFGPSDRSAVLRIARDKVKGPAVGLIVTAALGLVSIPFGVIQYVALDAEFEKEKREFVRDNPNASQQQVNDFNAFMDKFRDGMKVGLPVYYGLVASLILVALYGAIKMLRLQSRGLAYSSAILSMLPCSSGCCVLGIAFGIWAITVLGHPDVKRGFEWTAGDAGPADDYDPGFDRSPG
jgi:hypothetical protein